MDHDITCQLFDNDPLVEMSEISGDSLNWEDIWFLFTGFENVVKAVYPPTIDEPEYEVFYEWNGKGFIQQSSGLYEATGGDLGEDEDEY